ncbi:phosphotransferase [Labrys sedimenti]|uniref:phosphotransferase n=1 Tax=Labrys sedimenti TaxID=3106036 RepID=UPI002ACA6751|nr:phosphotransferase [Labrys sp. ZIDIC5]MDZ5448018.1 phosphotransferase [Labrys sp. ZIDIC5]
MSETVMPSKLDHHERLAALPLWEGAIAVEPIAGGLTNRNLLVTARHGRFVARIAGDNAAHDIDRAAEQAATRAAAASGLGPDVVWAEPGLMILRHIEGRTLGGADLRDRTRLRQVLALLDRIRRTLPEHYRGPTRDRSPLAILEGYLQRLSAEPNRWQQAAGRYRPLLDSLAARLADVPAGFAHNDVHGDNIIDDGQRLWLVDWEYAGRGQPLVDLASLFNNAGLDGGMPHDCLADWLGRPPTGEETQGFMAMRLAAAMRDLFWGYAQDGLVASQPGKLDRYIAINENRVRAAAAGL